MPLSAAGTSTLTTVSLGFYGLTNVQVTVPPALTSMDEIGLPSLHVALVWTQPSGTLSATEYVDPGARPENVCVFGSVPSASSSRKKSAGDRPPPAPNLKSVGSS